LLRKPYCTHGPPGESWYGCSCIDLTEEKTPCQPAAADLEILLRPAEIVEEALVKADPASAGSQVDVWFLKLQN